MKSRELPELKELPPNKTRVAVENALTLVMWMVWIWAAAHAVLDWRLLCVKYPALPALASAGAGAQVLLLAALWVRARSTLRGETTAAPRPLDRVWDRPLAAKSGPSIRPAGSAVLSSAVNQC